MFYAVHQRTVRLLLTLVSVAALGAGTTPPDKRVSAVHEDSGVPATFREQLKEYVALHRKLEATLPKLGKNATPQEIDKNQRALAALVQAARTEAKQGAFFTHEMQAYVREAMNSVFAGPEGKTLKASIMDENPGIPERLTVNERYPDDVPLSTMPPEVLSALPKLEEDMEFRFVGDYFVLLDAHAHLIVDFMDDVLPEQP
jgi:hypothetical protein